jgi:hypothetical protein
MPVAVKVKTPPAFPEISVGVRVTIGGSGPPHTIVVPLAYAVPGSSPSSVSPNANACRGIQLPGGRPRHGVKVSAMEKRRSALLSENAGIIEPVPIP